MDDKEMEMQYEVELSKKEKVIIQYNVDGITMNFKGGSNYSKQHGWIPVDKKGMAGLIGTLTEMYKNMD